MSNKKAASESDKYSGGAEFTNLVHYENFKSESRYVDGDLKFFPPVYVQRYEAVNLILNQLPWKNNLKKVVDFGCSEMGFFLYLKNISGLEEVLEVDVDDFTLDYYCSRVQPLNADYLFTKRSVPLEVSVLAGNIAEFDDVLIGADAVLAIEVIEHLELDDLRKTPYNIFHEIKPRLAVFTTPNAEFNTLFPKIKGFRHADHKFEWNREEFYNWARNIINDYPDYSVKFYGIGMGPKGTENLGCCTQMAVFERLTESKDNMLKGIKNYKLMRKVQYPCHVDHRSNEEKIMDEVYYRIKFSFNSSDLSNYDEINIEIPIATLMDHVGQWCESVEQLRELLLDNKLDVQEKNGEYVLLYTYNASENSNASESDIEDEGSFLDEEMDDQSSLEDWSLEYEVKEVSDSFLDNVLERFSDLSMEDASPEIKRPELD